MAVAALLQTQTSAIVTLKASGIESPKQLDGRKYASYEGRFEMPIVQQLIRDDGGKGTAIEVKPGEHGLGIFNTLLSKPDEYHATWVFMPWEGVIARQKGVDLNVFALDGVPYGYTPILVGREDLLEERVEVEGLDLLLEQRLLDHVTRSDHKGGGRLRALLPRDIVTTRWPRGVAVLVEAASVTGGGEGGARGGETAAPGGTLLMVAAPEQKKAKTGAELVQELRARSLTVSDVWQQVCEYGMEVNTRRHDRRVTPRLFQFLRARLIDDRGSSGVDPPGTMVLDPPP